MKSMTDDEWKEFNLTPEQINQLKDKLYNGP